MWGVGCPETEKSVSLTVHFAKHIGDFLDSFMMGFKWKYFFHMRESYDVKHMKMSG